MKRCWLRSVPTTYASTASGQVTSQRIAEAITGAENVRNLTTPCFIVNKEHTLSAGEQHYSATLAVAPTIPSNAQSGSTGNAFLMTCQLLINAPDGSHIRARGILDSGLSTSEWMTQSLHLPRSTRNVKISGIAGISHTPLLQPLQFLTCTHLKRSGIFKPLLCPGSCVTCLYNLSTTTQIGVIFPTSMHLAVPDFGQPNKIDILLGVSVHLCGCGIARPAEWTTRETCGI